VSTLSSRSDAQISEPEKPSALAQSTFCLKVSASSYEIHWSPLCLKYLTVAFLSYRTSIPLSRFSISMLPPSTVLLETKEPWLRMFWIS